LTYPRRPEHTSTSEPAKPPPSTNLNQAETAEDPKTAGKSPSKRLQKTVQIRQPFSEHPVARRFGPEQAAGALVLAGPVWEMPDARAVAAPKASDPEGGLAA
jgi:hypothetical protein